MLLENRFDLIQGFFFIFSCTFHFLCTCVCDSYLDGVLYFYVPTRCLPINSKLPFSVNS